MSDIASLGLSIDSRPVTDANSALDQLAIKGNAAATSADKLAAAGAKSETVMRAIQVAADREGISLEEMNKRVDQASASVSSHATASTKATTAVNSHAASLTKAGSAASSAKSELTHLDEITAVLESRMLGLGGNLGLIGQVLQVIGPVGLTAAAGLGAAVVVIDQLVSSANRLGDLSQQLQNLSIVSGLTTTQLQALQNEAIGFGLSTATTSAFLDRFTQQLDGARKGSGTLYAELLKIDPVLLAQISTAKTTTDALNLLSAAYVKAGASKNALASAAGAGRGAAGQVGLLLGDIASKGGVDNLTASVNQLDLLTQKQTADWAKLKTEIDDASLNARNNIASIFSDSVLHSEKNFYDGVLDLSRELKGFSLSDDFNKMTGFFTNPAASLALKTLIGAIPGVGGLVNAASSAYSSFTNRGARANARDKSSEDPNSLTPSSGVYSVTPGATGSIVGTPSVEAAKAALEVSFLGSAATAAERYNAAVLKLSADVTQFTGLTALQGRALTGLALDRDATNASSYATALGSLATTQDKVNVVSLNFQKAMLVNSRLTQDQLTGVKLVAQANDEWSRASASAQIGVFDLSKAQKAVNDQLEVSKREGLFDPKNPDQFAAATQAATNKLNALSDAAKVAGSAFPQITQLGLDAGNLNKQFDTFAVTSANAVTPALRDMLNGTTSLSAGFKSLGLTIVSALEDAIIKLTIIKPLLASLGLGGSGGGLLSLLGIGGGSNAIAAGGVVPGAVGATSVGGAPLISATGLHSGGVVGSESTFTRSVPSSVFANAPRFHTGMLSGEYPAILKKGESVLTPGQMAAVGGRGGDVHMTYAPVYQLTGTSEEIEKIKAAAANDREQFASNVVATVKRAQAGRHL